MARDSPLFEPRPGSPLHHSALLSVLILAALAVAAGCSADPADTVPSTPAGGDGGLASPEALAAFVPVAPPGWQLAGEPSAAALDDDGVPVSSVTALYVADDGVRTADLAIQDAAGRPAGLRRLAADLAANGTAPREDKLGGYPAYVVADGPVAGAYLLPGDRVAVFIAVAGGTRADLESFAAVLDLDGLAGLR